MLTALVATALVLLPTEESNALPLRLRGRSVALTAAELGRTCVSCRLLVRTTVAQKAKPPEPTPPPLLVPDQGYSPPPLLDSEETVPPPSGDLTPPPDVPSWQPPPATPPPPMQTVRDPQLGNVVGKEVAAGVLTLVLTDIVATGVVAGILFFSLLASFGSSETAVTGIAIAIALAIAHALLSPLWCAMAVKAMADEPTENGLSGAALGAYGSALGFTILFGGIGFAISMIATSAGSAGTGGVLDGVGTLITILSVFARWVGVPMFASWAMHRGTPPAVVAATSHPRRFVAVTSEGREEKPLSGATVLRF